MFNALKETVVVFEHTALLNCQAAHMFQCRDSFQRIANANFWQFTAIEQLQVLNEKLNVNVAADRFTGLMFMGRAIVDAFFRVCV